jgi:hypothetical protein
MRTRPLVSALVAALTIGLVWSPPVGATNPLPVNANGNLQYFGFFYTNGRYGNFNTEALEFTNTYVGISDGWETSVDWKPLLAQDICLARQANKRVYLLAGVHTAAADAAAGRTPSTYINLTNLTASIFTPCMSVGVNLSGTAWDGVSLVEVQHEPSGPTATAQSVEDSIAAFTSAIAPRTPRPYGILVALCVAENTCSGYAAVTAPSLNWVAVEAYPNNMGSLAQTQSTLASRLGTAKQNVKNAGKQVIFIPMAYDQAGVWSDVRDLTGLQRQSYDQAYNDSAVIGIIPFAYGWQSVDKTFGSTRLHAELKVPYFQMAERILGYAPAFTVNHRRYLAEGVQNSFFKTSIALTNPNGGPANVRVTLRGSDGTVASQFVKLVSMSRTTVFPEYVDATFGNKDFSIEVESDVFVGMDRLIRWIGDTGQGSHLESSVTGASPTWYFAEGSFGQELFYLFQNPNGSPTTVTITFLREGAGPVTKVYAVAPNSRFTIYANTIPELSGSGNLGASVSSTLPIIAERAVYLSGFSAGSGATGAPTLATTQYLVEGSTGSFFSTYLLLANPNATDASVQAQYFNEAGVPLATRIYTVPAQRRVTVSLDADPLLFSTAVWTRLDSLNGVGFVAERSMWWNDSGWYESHANQATPASGLGTAFVVSSAELQGKHKSRTYITVANPGAAQISVWVAAMFGDGYEGRQRNCVNPNQPPGNLTVAERGYVLNGMGRLTVDMEQVANTLIGTNCAIHSSSLVGARVVASAPVVVEGTVYSEPVPDDISLWSAGGNARAIKYQ